MARDDLEYVSLVDFKPGIYSKYSLTVGTTLGNDGAARLKHVTRTRTPGAVIPDQYSATVTPRDSWGFAPFTTFTTQTWTHSIGFEPTDTDQYWLLFVSPGFAPAGTNWQAGTGYWWSPTLPPTIQFNGSGTWVTAHLAKVDGAPEPAPGDTEAPGISFTETVAGSNTGNLSFFDIDPLAPTVVSLVFGPDDQYLLDPVDVDAPWVGPTVAKQTLPSQAFTYGSGNTYGGGETYGQVNPEQPRGFVQHTLCQSTGSTTLTWDGGGSGAVTAVILQVNSVEGQQLPDVVTEDTVYTYGCYGDPDGGLRPLPRMTERLYRNVEVDVQNGFAQPDAEIAILDINIVSPVLAYQAYEQNNTYGVGANWFTYAQQSGNLLEQPDDLHILMYYTSSTSSEFWPDNNNWEGLGGRPFTEWRQYRLHERVNRGPLISNMAYTVENPWIEQVLRRATTAIWPGKTGTTGPFNLFTPVPKYTSERYNQWWSGGEANNTTAGIYPSGSIAVGRTTRRLGTGYLEAPERGNEPGRICVVAMSDHTHGWKAMPTVADDGTEKLYPNLFGIYPDPLDNSLEAYFWAPGSIGSTGGGNGREVFPRFYGTNPPSPATTNPSDYHRHRLDRYTAFAAKYLIAHQDRFVGVMASTFTRSRSADYGAYQILDSNDVITYSEWNAVIQMTKNLLFNISPVYPSGLAPATGPNAGKYRAWSFWKINERYSAAADEKDPGTPGSNTGTNEIAIRQDIYGNETPSGIGTMVSNGNDLFIVKNNGGGVLVRGAMEDASVVQLPKIESTQHAIHQAVATPIGHVYGSRNGVFVWNGGETAERISAQLDGYFWDHGHKTGWGEERHNSSVGRFTYSYPFVYLPNGWVFDIRTGGWFRLNDPEEANNKYRYAYYVTNAFGDVYAVRAAFDGTEEGKYLVDLYSQRNGLAAQKYRWISQPVAKSINRTVMVEEIVLVAEGQGYVDITVRGLEDSADTQRFWVDSATEPIRLVCNLYLRASEITVQIDVASALEETGPDVPYGNAPTIHAVHLGTRLSHEEPHL